MYFTECNFMPLDPMGGIAKVPGNDVDGVETIFLPEHSEKSLEPFQKCIDECKKHDTCHSFTYCPSNSKLDTNRPTCRLKDAKFSEQEKTDIINDSPCMTIFKKCEEGIIIFTTEYNKTFFILIPIFSRSTLFTSLILFGKFKISFLFLLLSHRGRHHY